VRSSSAMTVPTPRAEGGTPSVRRGRPGVSLVVGATRRGVHSAWRPSTRRGPAGAIAAAALLVPLTLLAFLVAAVVVALLVVATVVIALCLSALALLVRTTRRP